jgi:aldehyde:ferredoxin oxidoreductase
MECYEKGLINEKDTDGLEVTWGNYEVMVQLIEKIARREGCGNLLAEGVRNMAEMIGKDSDRFAMHCKGQEWPMHEPRAKKGHGLSMATSNRGACHLQHESDDIHEESIYPEIGYDESISREGRDRLATGPEKAKQVKIIGDLYALYDTLPVCKWTVYACGGKRVGNFAEIINAATGWDVSIQELMLIGERAFNLCRAFNAREGLSRKDDMLPKRFMEDPLPDGPYKGEVFSKAKYEELLSQYYTVRGWTSNGIPTRTKLEELGLEDVARGLENLGVLPTKQKKSKK